MRTLSIVFGLTFFISTVSYSQDKIKSYLKNQMELSDENQVFPVIVKLNQQADIISFKNELLEQKIPIEQRRVLILKKLQLENQKPSQLIDTLNQWFRKYPNEVSELKSFWMVNAIALKLSKRLIVTLSDFDYISDIQYDMPVYGEKVSSKQSTNNRMVGGAESGLLAIGARGMWNLGYTGRNRIAMNIDTGVNIEHEAIGGRFLGHYLPVSQCWYGFEHNYPYDIDRTHYHGTHTMGTMIGLDTATADTIGLGFNAFWIASDPIVTDLEDVRPMSDYYLAFQWALNPDQNILTSSDIPDVINNSWGVNYSMWPDCNPIEYQFIASLEAADCAVVFSNGNEGPDASTTGMPASITQDSLNIFAVGALDAHTTNYLIADFSSRGPSLCDVTTSVGIKPEVSAPGVDVRSCAATGQFIELSGTSMAGPHVAGALVLLREAFPNVSSTALKNALYQTCLDLGTAGEDNIYGRGLINVYDAYLFLSQTYAPTPPVSADYELAIGEIEGKTHLICQTDQSYQVHIENFGLNAINQFSVRVRLNGDTILNTQIDQTILPGQSYVFPVNLTLVDTFTALTFEVFHTSGSEYNIYNNFQNFEVQRLFEWALPLSVNFEPSEGTLAQLGFGLSNSDNQNTWMIDIAAGLPGNSRSLRMPFAYYAPRIGQIDVITTPQIEVPITGNTKLYFKHAYTQYFSTRKDSLFVLVSSDCSFSEYDTLLIMGGAGMKTRNSNLIGNFVPSLENEWRSDSVDLTAYAGQNILIHLMGKNDQSNNLYIDDFRIENGLHLSDNFNRNELQQVIYPNPTSGVINVPKNWLGQTILITDVTGKQYKKAILSDAVIDMSTLKAGIYLLKHNNKTYKILKVE